MKHLSLFLLSLSCVFFVGCSTMAGLKQNVVIDSNPRGLEVVQDGEVIGRTPLIFKQSRRREHSYTLLDAEKKVVVTKNASCDFRWGSSLGGNAVFGLFQPRVVFGVLGLGVDLVSGAAYDCPDEVKFDSTSTFLVSYVEPPEKCEVYFVIPPAMSNELVGDDLAQKWFFEFQKQRTTRCATLVPLFDVRTLLGLYNTSPSREIALDTFSRPVLSDFALRSQATHIVFLDIENRFDRTHVHGVIHDVFSLAKVDEKVFEFPEKEVLALSGFASFVNFLVPLLPNSVAFSSTARKYSIKRNKDDEPFEESDASSPLLAGLTMQSVHRPDPNLAWDYSLPKSFWGTTRVPLFDRKFEGASYAMGGLKIMGILDTPSGAYAAGLSVGPGYFTHKKKNEAARIHYIGHFVGFDLSYTGFMSERFFWQIFGASSAGIAGVPNSTISISESGVQIGYLFPEARTYARRALK